MTSMQETNSIPIPTASFADENSVSAFLQQECERKCVEQKDGLVLGSWRLVFINGHGAQQERLILLTQHSVLRINLSFETGAIRHATRMPIQDIERVEIGPIRYKFAPARRVAAAFSGASGSALAEKTRALRVVMSDEFVDASDRGGFSGWFTGRDKMGVRCCTLTSKLPSSDAPDPADGPHSIHSFEAALRALLSELGRVAVVTQADVVVGTNAASLFSQVAVSDVKAAVAGLGRRDTSIGSNYLDTPEL